MSRLPSTQWNPYTISEELSNRLVNEFTARKSIQATTYMALVSLILSIVGSNWLYNHKTLTINYYSLIIIGPLIVFISIIPFIVSVDASASKLFMIENLQYCSLCSLAAGLRKTILEIEEEGRKPYECGRLEVGDGARYVSFNCTRPLHNTIYKLDGTSLVVTLTIMLLKNDQPALHLHVYVHQPLYHAILVSMKGIITDLKLRLRRRHLPERGYLITFDQELREDIMLEIGSLLVKIAEYSQGQGVTIVPT